MILSSLQYEPYLGIEESILPLNTISNGIHFLFRGMVDIYYKSSQKLISLGPGSYFGEISYLFNVRNQFYYQLMSRDQQEKEIQGPFIFSLTNEDLALIFKRFPQLKNILQIRALRRQRYLKKLKRYQHEFNQQKFMSTIFDA